MLAALLHETMQNFQACGAKFLFVNTLNFHLFSGHLMEKAQNMIITYIYIFIRITIESTIPGSLLAGGN